LRCPQIHQPGLPSRSSDPRDNHCNIFLAVKRQQGHLAAAQRPAICLSPTGHQSCRATGYGAIEAADGVSGLKVLQSDGRVDLLITDVGLRDVNGRQKADATRQSRRKLKVLFIIGYAENVAISNGPRGTQDGCP
jgi:CheY-like chemotaxis protein